MTFDQSTWKQGNPVAAAVLAKVWDKSLGKPSEENSAKQVNSEKKMIDWVLKKQLIEANDHY